MRIETPSAENHFHSGGFTLMELLISMTIMAVMVTIIAGALRLGLRAWEKGEADMAESQRQRAVLGLITQQLADVVTDTNGPYAVNPMALSGTREAITYISGHPILFKNEAWMVHARYEVVTTQDDTLALHYTEMPFVAAANPDQQFEAEGNKRERVLYGNLYQMAFEYLGNAAAGDPADATQTVSLETIAHAWQGVWDMTSEKGYPRAVRITLTSHEFATPLRMVIPVRSG